MKLLLRTWMLVLVVCAVFAAFSGEFNPAFGLIGTKPQIPCAPSKPNSNVSFCVK